MEYQLIFLCRSCKGRMRPTGEVITTFAGGYPHVCTKCGMLDSLLAGHYPGISRLVEVSDKCETSPSE